MAAKLEIADGTPVWISQSIIPSKDTVASPGISPSLAAVSETSKDVFVYVKVDNVGTVPFGLCLCTAPLPAVWKPMTFFTGSLFSKSLSASDPQGLFTFTAKLAGDSISGGGISHLFGPVASGRRAWGWSQDGRFFAYAAAVSGPDWNLTIIALKSVTLSDGTVKPAGTLVVSGASGLFAGNWDTSNFGWAGSKAVVATGKGAGGGIARVVACPESPGTKTWGELVPDFPGQIEWVYLSSPCGSVVAIVPKILAAAAGSRNAFLVSTANATVVPFRKSNVPTAVSITGASPSITTVTHTANGVSINTGGGTVTVDDPDCAMAVGGIDVVVDRVKASTLPSANLGVMSVGKASLGLLAVGQTAWVKVPNTNPSGWNKQSESHWCLLAQAFTTPPDLTIPRPWNGQVSPPPFPISNQNCAQRNIYILP